MDRPAIHIYIYSLDLRPAILSIQEIATLPHLLLLRVNGACQNLSTIEQKVAVKYPTRWINGWYALTIRGNRMRHSSQIS